MEMISLKLGNDAAFNEVVHNSATQGSAVEIITKDKATSQGRAGAVIVFIAIIDGKEQRVQATVPVRVLTTALAGLRGRYGDDGICQVQ